MNSKFAVIGLGKFGSRIARSLASRGAEVIAIDINENHVDALRDEVAHAVILDSTDIRALKSQRLDTMQAIVVAIGEDFEASLLTATHLMDMKVRRIIVRASGQNQIKILAKLGVKEILSPEEEVGGIVAERLLHPTIKTFLQLPDDYEISEIKPPEFIVNKTVEEIRFREKYNLSLISLKREFEIEKNGEIIKEKHLLGVPQYNTVIYQEDIIIILGKNNDIQKFIDINS